MSETAMPWLQRRIETYDANGTLLTVTRAYSDFTAEHANYQAAPVRRAEVRHLGNRWQVRCYVMPDSVNAIQVKDFPLTRGSNGRATNFAHAWLREVPR